MAWEGNGLIVIFSLQLQGEHSPSENLSDEDKYTESFIKKVVAAHDKIASMTRINQHEREKKIDDYVVSLQYVFN